MSGFIRQNFWIVSLILFSGLIGCQDKNKEMTAQPQQDTGVSERIRELESRLAEEESARVQAENEALALRNQVDQLKAKLAEAQTSEGQGWSSFPGGAMTDIEGVILFDSGEAKLKKTAAHKLNEIVRVIQNKYPNRDIYVFGHTDSQPIRKSDWKDNLELSCARAAAVIRFLRTHGTENEMAACGWGMQRPVESNTSPSGQQANRRVEVYAMTPKR
jgi:chemotaxis protein MotB